LDATIFDVTLFPRHLPLRYGEKLPNEELRFNFTSNFVTQINESDFAVELALETRAREQKSEREKDNENVRLGESFKTVINHCRTDVY
jgi:hypothetical protein